MLLKPFELQQESAEYLIRKKQRPLIPESTKVVTSYLILNFVLYVLGNTVGLYLVPMYYQCAEFFLVRLIKSTETSWSKQLNCYIPTMYIENAQ